MKPLSVPRWTAAGFSTTALMILVLAGFSWNFAQQTLAAASFVSHTHKVIGELNELESTLFQAEASQRAFLLTRQHEFIDQRDSSVARFEVTLAEVRAATGDNPAQQARLDALSSALRERLGLFRQTEQQIRQRIPFSAEDRMLEGNRVLGSVRPLLKAMLDDENRLLEERSLVEERRATLAGLLFAAFIVILMALVPVVNWRLRRDLRARQEAEFQVAEEQRYDVLHARALTLYNAQPTREGVMKGTLDLLAELPLFPASLFYAYEELGGLLRRAASHAAPSDAKHVLRLDEGPVGAAARSLQPVYIDRLDPDDGLRIETGLARLAPAAMLMSPVTYQGRLMGVLVLAAAGPLSERDRGFVARLSAQFGVALHNLGQMQELSLLAEQLRVRGEDIQVKNAELERASRMKSEFLANMSHELRTPLNAVIGFSEILKDGMLGELTEEQTEYITDIFTSGKHLLSLINDILDLSKVESGHSPLDLEPVEPIQLAISGLSVMRDKAAASYVKLESVCDPSLGPLMLDSRKAKQIVYNLLANAVKFTHEGGRVTLSLGRMAQAEVRSAAEPGDGVRVFLPEDFGAHDDYLVISVADSGIGIEPVDLQRLFQPFVQIDSSLSRKYSGTGLGLTMVKRLAELHGGGLMVRSQPERGSTFTVWLPWREKPQESDTAMQRPDPLPLALPLLAAPTGPVPHPLVLVVEDDPRTANLIGAQLTQQGYRIALAKSAEEGLRRAAELRPAAVVLDIILPGMNGWDMLSQLKDHADTRDIPVVIVSMTDEAQRGFALGASQVLTKPVSQEDLLAAIAAVDVSADTTDAPVLVVDDDPKALTLVSKHLEVAGFQPVTAFSGNEALDMVRRKCPALIILDLMMPEVSGFEVVDKLRSEPRTADIPIIVLTAKLLTPEDRALLHGRVEQVMEKSEFQSSSLLAEVRRALAKRRASRVPEALADPQPA